MDSTPESIAAREPPAPPNADVHADLGAAHAARTLEAVDVQAFAQDFLLSPERAAPVVAISSHPTRGGYLLDPDALARELGELADVVQIETGEATWALSATLPERLDVYGGAARIWWPGLGETSDPYRHPLLFVRSPDEAEVVQRRIVAAIRDGDKAAGSYGPWRPRANAKETRADLWPRLLEVYKVGDVVRGRVTQIRADFVLVEVLPEVQLLAHISELDWTFVTDPANIVHLGEHVRVKILTLDPAARKGLVSIKKAYGVDPLPAVTPCPGEPPFLEDGSDDADIDTQPALAQAQSRAARADEELQSVLADRKDLMQQLKAAKEREVGLRRDLRSLEDRLRVVEAQLGGQDPAGSEVAFLTAIRMEYARRCDEGDRQRYPLQRMRLGREFLERLRELDGIQVEKVVQVCMQVACQRAHEVPGREVHPLRSGPAGAASQLRARDGAKAWRCSLQDNTASARRLHWWDIPGADGRTIEFASVAVHDDFSIPG
ncbi:MAG: S1 RNA-binding domain-containing protein [Planctomycetes bacterium]|nr:S1 RNA-binding domain-containing protein [Planctomycetota bacterium]